MNEVTSSFGMATVKVSDYLTFMGTEHNGVLDILDGCKWGQSPFNSANEFKYDSALTTQISNIIPLSSLPASLALSSFAGSTTHKSMYSDFMATRTGFVKADCSVPEFLNVSNTRLILDQVESIIDLFKLQVQDHNLWRIFWTRTHNTFAHAKEFTFNMMLYAISESWLKASNSNMRIEQCFDKSLKAMHIKFSYMDAEITVKILNLCNCPDLKQLIPDNNTIYVLLNFEFGSKTQGTNVAQICKLKIIEIDVSIGKFYQQDKSIKDLWLRELCAEFEGGEYIDDHYIQEKRKGGTNSYKNYKPLKDKVEEICKQELEKRHYRSALSLRNAVAIIIEENHKELLDKFVPYTQTTRRGADWRQSTFYNWCKAVFKLATCSSGKIF